MKNIFKIRNSRSQSGFSLIEVAVSFLMIAVTLVLLASALNLVNLSRKLRFENYAYHIANKQMETLRAMDYNDLPASGTIVDTMLAELPAGSGSYTVTNYPGFANLKEIVVTVDWTYGMDREIIIKTLTGVGGINN